MGSSSSPSSDRHVSARAILRALAQVQRWGEARAMRRLEELEPDEWEWKYQHLPGEARSFVAVPHAARSGQAGVSVAGVPEI